MTTSHHPASALLVLEVSDTSLAYDRTRKLAAYARAGIPEYWPVNLVASRLEVHRDPEAGTYRTRLDLGPTDRVSPLARPRLDSASRIFCRSPSRRFRQRLTC